MSQILSVDLTAIYDWTFTETLTLSSVVDSGRVLFSKTFSHGTGDDQCDLVWHAQSTIAAAGSDAWDLTALTTTLYGDALTLTFAKVKLIYIMNLDTTAAQDLFVDGTVANAFLTPFGADASSKIDIPAESDLMLENSIDGWAVTAGTGDILNVANDTAAGITYDIILAGTSA